MSDNITQSAAPAASTAASVEATSQTNTETSQESIEGQESENNALEATDSSKEAEKVKKEVEKEVKRIKKYKLKVDGKEFDEEINLDDDEDLTRRLQLGKMGQKRAQEKAELETQIEAFVKALKENPMAVLGDKSLGVDVNKMVEDYINEQIENSKKSPEQLEREKLEKELKTMKDEREKEKKDQESRELQRLQAQEYERYDILMSQALEKSDLPKTPYVVKKMADYMLLGLQNGYEVTPDDILPLVREEMHSEINEMFQAMPEEVIEKLLGDGVLNKLRKRRVAKAQNPPQATTKSKVQDAGKPAEKSKAGDDKQSYKDFFKI